MSDTLLMSLKMLNAISGRDMDEAGFMEDMLHIRLDKCENIADVQYAVMSKYVSHLVCYLGITMAPHAMKVIIESLDGQVPDEMKQAVRDATEMGLIPEEVGTKILEAMENPTGDGIPEEIANFINSLEK
jgi:hypothetical protein